MRRRELLLASAGLFGLGALGRSSRLLAAPKWKSDPFTLGVASGEPSPDGFVIWTRLAPDPLDGGGMPEASIVVEWFVAEDEQLTRIVRKGLAHADPAWAHSVHVEVQGLKPDRWYWYAFQAGGARSQLGRSRTVPLAGVSAQRLRFAFASCQHYEHGYYAAYGHMAEDDLDCVLHLGDYIYESHSDEGVRSHGAGPPRTLDEYRNRHALYKTDADLQRAHARFPWIVTWDDHDVQNDYAGAHSEFNDPPEEFLLRRAAAYQAYWEHLPLRYSARPRGPGMTLYRQLEFGTLAQFFVVDDRQYRDDQACGSPEHWGGQVVVNCPEREAPGRTMYGAAQERWLYDSMAASGAQWNVLAQQLLMAQLDQKPGPEHGWWTDGWDGYPAARKRLLAHISESEVKNPVVLGGDIHSFWTTDLKRDFDDPKSPVVATEFVGTSISSHGPPYDKFARVLPKNPHVRFFDSRRRGYARCEITPRSWRTDFMALDDVREAASGIRQLASFTVEAGRPGAVS